MAFHFCNRTFSVNSSGNVFSFTSFQVLFRDRRRVSKGVDNSHLIVLQWLFLETSPWLWRSALVLTESITWIYRYVSRNSEIFTLTCFTDDGGFDNLNHFESAFNPPSRQSSLLFTLNQPWTSYSSHSLWVSLDSAIVSIHLESPALQR